MSRLKIEKIGGFAGFGGQKSHLRSRGEIDIEKLSKEDKNTVENLFQSKRSLETSKGVDTFKYRVSRMTSNGMQSVEADESEIPNALKQCVRDEII